MRKPIREFGRAKYYLTVGAKDGLNVQCKKCRRDDMNQRRAKAKAKELERKPNVLAPRETPADKVLNAIAKGHRTRDAIRLFTNLDEDSISDALARLAFDEESVRIVKVTDEEREFHLAA